MLTRTLLGGQGIVEIELLPSELMLDVAARPVDGLPYTVYGLLWHIDFGQRRLRLLLAMGGEQTAWPPVEQQWPQHPPTRAEFEAVLASLRAGLQRAAAVSADPVMNPRSGTLSAGAGRDLETLVDLAVHSAYH